MKNFTLLTLSALLLGAGQAGAQTTAKLENAVKLLTKIGAAKPDNIVPFLRKAPTTSIWRATHEQEFDFDTPEDGQEGAWTFMADYYYKYDEKGNVLENTVKEDGSTSTVRRTNKYNENGMVVYQIDETVEEDGTVVPSVRRTCEYDNVVPSLITKRTTENYDESAKEWQMSGNTYTRTVTRNADGNVTSVVVATLYEGKFDPSERITLTYDETTKKPVTYKYEQLTSNDDGGFEWETSVALKNMVWDRTNGQITNVITDYYEGENRLKSATLYEVDADGEDYDYATMTIDYDDKGGYVQKVLQAPYLSQIIKKYTDDNGSYTALIQQFGDYNGDGKYTDDELESNEKVEEKFDAHGNQVEYAHYLADEAPQNLNLQEGSKFELQYDDATGCLKESVQSDYDPEAGEYTPFMKIVSDGFVDVTATGINKLDNAEKAGVSAVYNLHGQLVGRSLENVSRGVYVVKSGNKTVKVVKR